MLLLAEKDEEYREYLSQTALRIVGDAAILKAMGEERKDRLEELENHSFQTQLLKELSENGRPVAVLTETEAEKEKTVENLKRNTLLYLWRGPFLWRPRMIWTMR